MQDSSKADSSYSRSVQIRARPSEIFQALTQDLQSWWGAMDVPVARVGDQFTVSWGEPWYRFEVTRYEPYRILSWTCIDANQIIAGLEGVQKEWVGTQLHWRVEAIDTDTSEITFTHQGLVPDFTCFNFCAATWDEFIGERLKSYLEG